MRNWHLDEVYLLYLDLKSILWNNDSFKWYEIVTVALSMWITMVWSPRWHWGSFSTWWRTTSMDDYICCLMCVFRTSVWLRFRRGKDNNTRNIIIFKNFLKNLKKCFLVTDFSTSWTDDCNDIAINVYDLFIMLENRLRWNILVVTRWAKYLSYTPLFPSNSSSLRNGRFS